MKFIIIRIFVCLFNLMCITAIRTKIKQKTLIKTNELKTSSDNSNILKSDAKIISESILTLVN